MYKLKGQAIVTIFFIFFFFYFWEKILKIYAHCHFSLSSYSFICSISLVAWSDCFFFLRLLLLFRSLSVLSLQWDALFHTRIYTNILFCFSFAFGINSHTRSISNWTFTRVFQFTCPLSNGLIQTEGGTAWRSRKKMLKKSPN